MEFGPKTELQLERKVPGTKGLQRTTRGNTMLFPSIRCLPKTRWSKKTVAANHDVLIRVSNSHVEPDENCAHRAQFQVGDLYDVIPGRLAFSVHSGDDFTLSEIRRMEEQAYFFSCDLQDRYEPFCSDFGPVKLSVVHRFCKYVHEKVTNPRLEKRLLVYYCDNEKASCSNTAFLLGCYAMIHWSFTPEQASGVFTRITSSPIAEFRDATFRPADYTLSLLDCFRGLRRGVEQAWFQQQHFDVDEYEYWDDVDNGDFHEISPKFIAFRGPESAMTGDIPSTSPESLVPVFKQKGVTAVVRLNENSSYDARAFTDNGIQHFDLFFEDCGVPPLSVVREFLDVCDQTKGRIAVHCMAGLGRTGTMIGLWMMKNLQWGADECIAWLRIVRPGSVIGAQQHFLKLCEGVSWHGNTPLLPAKTITAKTSVRDARGLLAVLRERGSKTLRTHTPPRPTKLASLRALPSPDGGRAVTQASGSGPGLVQRVRHQLPRYQPSASLQGLRLPSPAKSL